MPFFRTIALRVFDAVPLLSGTALGFMMVAMPGTEPLPTGPLAAVPASVAIERAPAAADAAAGAGAGVGAGADAGVAAGAAGNAAAGADADQVAAVPPMPRLPADPPWRRNAMPAHFASGQPILAVVIDDMGFDNPWSEAAIHLPAPVTLSFLPYVPDLTDKARQARARGHEVMVHMPSEPDSHAEDPGPLPLEAGMSAAEIGRRLDLAIGRFDGFVGLNNHMGSRFTQDPTAMAAMLRHLKERGLLFVDSFTSRYTVGGTVAYAIGLPYAARDVFLDDEDDAAPIARRLAELERIALHAGHAIGIGHPRPRTLEALAGWLPRLKLRGIALVPVSAVVRRRMGEG